MGRSAGAANVRWRLAGLCFVLPFTTFETLEGLEFGPLGPSSGTTDVNTVSDYAISDNSRGERERSVCPGLTGPPPYDWLDPTHFQNRLFWEIVYLLDLSVVRAISRVEGDWHPSK